MIIEIRHSVDEEMYSDLENLYLKMTQRAAQKNKKGIGKIQVILRHLKHNIRMTNRS